MVDVDTKEICDIQVFDDSKGENNFTKQCIENTIKNKDQPIDVLFGDGAYDSYENFEMLNQLNIKTVIPVRKNSVQTPPTNNKYIFRRRNINKNKKTIRTLVAQKQLKNKELWKKQNEYGMRWAVEGVFSSIKRLFGNSIVSKNKKNAEKEMILKASLYNLIINN